MTFLIIDATNIASRAFYTEKSTLFSMIQKAIKEVQPAYFAACFDSPGDTFRHKLYPGYKASREPNIERSHFCNKAREAFLKSSLPTVAVEGYEADDLCYTMAVMSWYSNVDAVIMSGDSDLLQCVTEAEGRPSIKVKFAKSSKNSVTGKMDTTWDIYGYDMARDEFGIEPWQIPFYKALVGDSSDNIPGIPKCGPVMAKKLIDLYQSPLVFTDQVATDAGNGYNPMPNPILTFFSQPDARGMFLLWAKLATLVDVPGLSDKSKFGLEDYKDFSTPLFSEAARLLLV